MKFSEDTYMDVVSKKIKNFGFDLLPGGMASPGRVPTLS